MKFTIKITEEAIEDMECLDKAACVTILDAIERQFVNQPLQEIRNCKPLRLDSQ